MSAMLGLHLAIRIRPSQLLGGVGAKFANVLASTVVNLHGPMLVVPLVNSSGSISRSLAEAGSVASRGLRVGQFRFRESRQDPSWRGKRARPSCRSARRILKAPLDRSRIRLTVGDVRADQTKSAQDGPKSVEDGVPRALMLARGGVG